MFSQSAAQFGLKGNPFDSSTLSASVHSLLPIATAFVGREMSSSESRTITNILRIPGGGRFVVEWEVGVGKTTFVNYHRYLWENETQDRLLTPIQEIVVDIRWGLKEFVFNILGALINKLVLLKGKEEAIAKDPLLREILILTKVYSSSSIQWQGSFMGAGLGYGKNTIITVPKISETQLVYYFQLLVQKVKEMGYAGIFLHIYNFDQISQENPKDMQLFFHKIRDILQIHDVYYAFVGYPGFYSQIINPIERVRSIFFLLPIYLPPLTEDKVLEAIKKRYQLLSDANFIKPVEDAFVRYLYHLYQGKFRSILDSLSSLLSCFPPYRVGMLTAQDAKEFLSQTLTQQISGVLTPKELSVLLAVSSQEECTGAEIARKLKMQPENVSRAFKELEKHHFIYLVKRIGTRLFYKINEQLKIIQSKTDNFPVDYKEKHTLSNLQKQFMEVLQSQEKINLTDFCQSSTVPIHRIRSEVKELVRFGFIEQHGYTKGTYYTKSR
ncbi:MAG: MarR family transcriptional regulator [Candidatus Brocadiae bacterium]|nr:MarR family transcriptional regulator [Candidatus Brocadiia bacterium]